MPNFNFSAVTQLNFDKSRMRNDYDNTYSENEYLLIENEYGSPVSFSMWKKSTTLQHINRCIKHFCNMWIVKGFTQEFRSIFDFATDEKADPYQEWQHSFQGKTERLFCSSRDHTLPTCWKKLLERKRVNSFASTGVRVGHNGFKLLQWKLRLDIYKNLSTWKANRAVKHTANWNKQWYLHQHRLLRNAWVFWFCFFLKSAKNLWTFFLQKSFLLCSIQSFRTLF